MKERIEWVCQGVDMPEIDMTLTSRWIEQVAKAHGYIVGPIVYIFCDDKYILDVNRRFLNHDYYTDIITFDYSRGKMISGDMFISLDTVNSNAEKLKVPYFQELNRVIIHGILHLCGIDDKGPGEREIMEANEDEALSLLQSTSSL